MDERLLFIIEPAVHHLQTIHQPLGIIAEVGLAVTEFMIIKPRFQSLPVDPVLHNIRQHRLDQLYKFLLLLLIGILRDHREDRLIDPVIIRAHDILPDPRIRKSLLKRRPRCRQQRVIQDLERQIQLLIKTGADHLIVGKIGIINLRFLACYRIGKRLLQHFPKRLLIPDLGIHRPGVKGA